MRKKENKKKPDSCLTSFLWKKIPPDSNDPHIPLLSDSAAVSDYSLNISDNGAYQEEKQPHTLPRTIRTIPLSRAVADFSIIAR